MKASAPVTSQSSKDRDTLLAASENRQMFDAIARRYDLMNRIISLGFDRSWRRRAIAELAPRAGGWYLDLGTGTGDLMEEIRRQQPAARVVGLDPARGMLGRARQKLAAPLPPLLAGDGLHLPVSSQQFDGLVSGFCLRNMEHHLAALREMRRVLRPGGRLVIPELTTPPNKVMALLHGIFGKTAIPLTARILSQMTAYRYLIESVKAFPSPATLVELMATAGLVEPRALPLTGGVVHLFVARAPVVPQ